MKEQREQLQRNEKQRNETTPPPDLTDEIKRGNQAKK
jgi:hypothetical protein